MPIPRTCEVCGVVFPASPSRVASGNGLFCSMECYAESLRTRRSPVERFWTKVNKNGPVVRPELGPCWVWTGARSTAAGYGKLWLPGARARAETVFAHRFSWELHHGTGLGEEHVLHRCDNPPCVNPAHLFLGTARDNVNDRDAKGRTRQGSAHRNARLTEASVKRMRALYATGQTSTRELAQLFRVSHQTAWDIVRRRTWKATE